MNLIKFSKPAYRNSFENLFDDLFKTNINDALNRNPSWNTPSTNIIQTDNGFVIELAVPGITKDDIEIKLDKDLLAISASKEEETLEKKKVNYTKREFNYSSFSKSFHLTEDIDSSDIKAAYENGILKIELKKLEKAEPEVKQIKIK